MKKFFTRIPLQTQGNLKELKYNAQGNQKLQMEQATCFPILTAIHGYTEDGEDIRVIAIVADTEAEEYNYQILCKQVEKICVEKNITCSLGVEKIQIKSDQSVLTQTDSFQKMIDVVADDDELFACMTYGTKPQSTALMMAIQYAYRIKRNASISCIVYGEVVRPNNNQKEWSANVYDMTALIQLDEIVRMLAERGVENPQQTIEQILAL